MPNPSESAPLVAVSLPGSVQTPVESSFSYKYAAPGHELPSQSKGVPTMTALPKTVTLQPKYSETAPSEAASLAVSFQTQVDSSLSNIYAEPES